MVDNDIIIIPNIVGEISMTMLGYALNLTDKPISG
jgi:hypothetical protein